MWATSWIYKIWQLVLAKDLTNWKTLTFGNGPVLPPNTRHFTFTILAPIQYLSSDRIMTWSMCILCSISGVSCSLCQICNQANIHCVAMNNQQISHTLWFYFTVIQRILVRLQIWNRQEETRLKLHNLRIGHALIQAELGYWFVAKVAGAVK